MLFSTRTTLQLLLAISAAIVSVRADYDYDMLESRELAEDYLFDRDLGSSLGHQPAYSRGYADGEDFILSARDLMRMGVRSDDISHVLVVRTGGRPRSPSPSEKAAHQAQIKKYEASLKEQTKILKDLQKKLKSETNAEAKKKLEREIKSQRGYVDHSQSEIEDLQNLINGGH